jgi:hypothetical protein
VAWGDSTLCALFLGTWEQQLFTRSPSEACKYCKGSSLQECCIQGAGKEEKASRRQAKQQLEPSADVLGAWAFPLCPQRL